MRKRTSTLSGVVCQTEYKISLIVTWFLKMAYCKSAFLHLSYKFTAILRCTHHTTLDREHLAYTHTQGHHHCWSWELQIVRVVTGDQMGNVGGAIQWSCFPWRTVDWPSRVPRREQAAQMWNKYNRSLQWMSMWGYCISSVPLSMHAGVWNSASGLRISHHSCCCWGVRGIPHTSYQGNHHGHFALCQYLGILLRLSLVVSWDLHSKPVERICLVVCHFYLNGE